MTALGEGALIADVVGPEAVGCKEIITMLENDIALSHVVLDDVLGLKTGGNVPGSITHIEQRVGVLVGNQ